MFSPPETVYLEFGLPTAHGYYIRCSFKKQKGNNWNKFTQDPAKCTCLKSAEAAKVYLCFDLSNGDACETNRSEKNYVWVCRTKEEALERCRFHRSDKHKYATLSKPFGFFPARVS